jgi:hypothetical protein
VDRHSFDAYPDPTFYFDADPDSNPNTAPSFAHIGKSEKKSGLLFTAVPVPVYIVLSFSSAS